MTKLIRFWAVVAMLAASQFASSAFAGIGSLFLSIRLDVTTSPAPAVQPVVTGDFTYSIVCNRATFATPASTITLTAVNGTTPVVTFGNASSSSVTGSPNDCTYSQLSRPAAPAGFIWVGTPPDVVQTNILGEAPPAQFSNRLTQAFTITTVASPPASGSVSCAPNPVPSGQTSSCTASPNSGYTFAGFSTSSCGGASTNNPYTTSALAADCTVTGTFTVAPINGVCGSANTVATGTAPTANLCSVGTASTVAASVSQFTWSCAGNVTGTTSSCAAPRTYAVTSSVSGGNGTISPTSTQTVASGAKPIFTVAPVSGYSASVGGTCNGTLIGNTFTTNAVVADCTVIASFTLIPVNGVCGSANTVATGAAPSANLCSAGTASAVTSGVSQFTWSCVGIGTGSTASCAAPRTYTVSSSVSGGNGTITPTPTQTVASGAKPTFTLTPSTGYSATVSGTCSGTLVGNTYTTNAVVADCTVIASFTLMPVNGVCGSANAVATGVAPSANLCSAGTASAVTGNVSQFTWSCAGIGAGTTASCAAPRTYTVTSSVNGGNGTFTPISTQIVASGATATYTITPSTGYFAFVGGTCNGTLVGNTFTTQAVVADCSVIAGFSLIPVNGACGSANAVAVGVAPSANLCSAGAASVVTSSQSQFTWSCAGVGLGYGVNCAAPRTYTVTSSVSGSNGTITPSSTQTVASGAQPTFTLAPASGYSASVGGTCGGNLAGTTYTANAVAANCTVIAAFSPNSFAITTVASPADGGAVVCTPNPVTFGATASCVATPATGYAIAPFVASAAPGPSVKAISPAVSGGISGCGGVGSSTNPFITAPITAACTVTANFVLITVPVSALAVAANGGTVNCAPNAVNFGSTSTCTATANVGFTLTSISGCGGATTSTSPFVTGAVTAPCTVTANFTPLAAPIVNVPVPTLGGWTLLLLMLLTGAAGGAYVLRANRR